MKDVNKFFSSLCYRHCWLSTTFYRTEISLIGLQKQSLLGPYMTIFRFSAYLVSYLKVEQKVKYESDLGITG